MRGLRRMRICVMALAVLFTAALPASAQLTTGSVGGTVKDPQGAVIPGATVTLVSETRGTKSVPVVTNAAGDFVFPNIPADTYTIEVEMPSFKTLRQSGISVNPGPQVAVGALTLEVGGATETVSVKGESPVIQTASGERSFAIPTETVQNLPFASRSFLQLGALAPGVVMNGTQVQRLGSIVQSTTVMMDGVSTMDTGSNGAIVQHEHGVDRGGQDPRAGIPGRVRAIERAADQRGQQERHEPVPRLPLQRAAQFRLERQQQDEHPQRPPQADPETAGSRLFDRRPDREAGRQQQAVLLPCARVPAAHRRQRRLFVPDADGAGAAGRLLADAATTSATCTRTSRTRTSPACARRRARPPASRDGGVLGRIPASRPLPAGPEHPEDVAPAEQREHDDRAQLSDHQAGREHPRLSAGGSLRLSAHGVPAGERQVPGRHSASADRSTARSPASTIRRWCIRASAPRA